MNISALSLQCGCCGCESKHLFRARDYNRKITNNYFQYYKCECCGLIFIESVPDNINIYYPDNYYYIPKSLDYIAKASDYERYKIDIVKRFATVGKLLEIGPAYGSFAYLAKEAGFDVEVVEMSERCCRFIRDVIGVRAINTNDPIGAVQNEGPYDVITLWHVLEHLPNPWSALETISARLKSGGVLVIAAPNPDAFQFSLMGRFWPHLDAPRHVVLIPMRVLEQRAKRHGLVLELATTTDPGSLGWNTFGWEFLFANLGLNRYYRKIAFRVGRLVSKFFAPFEKCEGRGSAYTFVFRKDV